MFNKIKSLWSYRTLLYELTLRDFRGKYIASTMGVFWSLLNPLLLLLVFTFVFSVIFDIRLGPLPGFRFNGLYIFCGILPWLSFQEALQRSSTVFIEQKTLVTRLLFPAGVLPAAITCSTMLGMVIGFLILLLAVYILTSGLHYYALFLLLVLLLQCLFTFGLSMFVATVNVYFRDLQQLLPVGLLVWMYGTPIFYSPEMVEKIKPIDSLGIAITGERLKFLLTMNPIHHLIAIYRAILLEKIFPFQNLLWFIAFVFGSLFLGVITLNRGKRGFADVL